MDRALYFISEMYCHRLRALMEAVAVGHPSRPRLAGAEGFDDGISDLWCGDWLRCSRHGKGLTVTT